MDTYEKKYKEALERAKEQLETAKVFDYKEGQIAHDIRTTTYAIFPELKEESEDEKTERILHSISSKMSLHLRDTFTEEEFQYFDTWSNAWLEKQGEQKPIDKPKFKVKYAGREYNVLEIKENMGITWYGIEDEPNHIDYVKANSCEIISGYAIKENGSPYPTKIAVFSEQKQTDEDMKEALRTEYEKGRADAFAQMQKEWSEEDEEMFEYTINLLNYNLGCRKWLQSLKERHIWKPSDTQIRALEYIIDNAHNTSYSCKIAKELLEQLRKLKGE